MNQAGGEAKAKLSKDEAEALSKAVQRTYETPIDLTAERLTIGCEFEFVLSSYRPAQGDWDHPQALREVTDALKETYRVVCSHDRCNKDNVKYDHNLKVRSVKKKHKPEDLSHWKVTDDCSISLDASKLVGSSGKDYQFFPIEVTSRVLRFDEHNEKPHSLNHHWIAFDREIKSVLDRLNEWFDGTHKERKGLCLIATPSCGFHIHIGNGVQTPLPWETIIRVFQMTLACEKQIDRLHSKDRISGTGIVSCRLTDTNPSIVFKDNLIKGLDKPYNPGFSQMFLQEAYLRRWMDFNLPTKTKEQTIAAHRTEPEYGYDIGSWLHQIDKAEDVRALTTLLASGKNCVVNITNCPTKTDSTEALASKKLTIEFRQHTGTLDPSFVLPFVDFVVKLALKCSTLSDSEMKRAIGVNGLLRSTQFSTYDFCRWIECNRSTSDFYNDLTHGAAKPVEQQLRSETRAHDNAKANGGSGLIARLPLREQLKQKLELTGHETVRAAVNEKFKHGGYGQFSDEDLEELFPEYSEANLYNHLRLDLPYRSPVDNVLYGLHRKKFEGEDVDGPTQRLEDRLKAHASTPFHETISPAAGPSKGGY